MNKSNSSLNLSKEEDIEMYCFRTRLLCTPQFKLLDPKTMLSVIRLDPGHTALYYAQRYFGQNSPIEVNAILWSNLKMQGQIRLERDREESALWFPETVCKVGGIQDAAAKLYGDADERRRQHQKREKTEGHYALGETNRPLVEASEWKESVDPTTGDTFYYNAAGETTWNAPGTVGSKETGTVSPITVPRPSIRNNFLLQYCGGDEVG